MNYRRWIVDQKVRGLNVSADMTIGEYYDLSQQIMDKNQLQRKRVGGSSRTYELLRRDLIEGCVVPPLILAVTEAFHAQKTDIGDAIQACLDDPHSVEQHRTILEQFIDLAAKQSEMLILDGLQRTFTIRQCIDDAQKSDQLDHFRRRPLRVEIYIGLRKLGLLYRMMTLNTGQTPMSFRHQIEIMYQDYLDADNLPEGMTVIREVEGARARGLGKYKYQDVVDMFYAFTTGNPQSIDRPALVAQLKELDFLEDFQPEEEGQDLLRLLTVYHRFVLRINSLAGTWHFDPAATSIGSDVARPFGTDIVSIFGKVQAMTGFGAEAHRLIREQHKYGGLDALELRLGELAFGSDAEEALNMLVQILDQIAQKAKKIGDAQRAYFQLAFRKLFHPESEAFLDLSQCWLAAQEQYETMY